MCLSCEAICKDGYASDTGQQGAQSLRIGVEGAPPIADTSGNPVCNKAAPHEAEKEMCGC